MPSTAVRAEETPQDVTFAYGKGSVARYTGLTDASAYEGGTSIRTEGRFNAVVRAAPSMTNASRHQNALAPRAEWQRTVRVDVLEVGADVASCQIIQLGGQDVSLELPLALFPDEAPPRFGLSYDLEMSTENGIRRPVLTLRPGNPDALREQKQALQQLAALFGN